MATKQSTIDYLLDQCGKAGAVRARKMFGEYALYHGDTLVALVCNGKLYVKPTAVGRAYIGDVEEAPPYKGAKPSFLISEERWYDSDWLSELIMASAKELPASRPRKVKSGPQKK